MRLDQLANDNLTIRACNWDDFLAARKVANLIADDPDFVFGCEDDIELWVQVTASWLPYQAERLKQAYIEAKAVVTK